MSSSTTSISVEPVFGQNRVPVSSIPLTSMAYISWARPQHAANETVPAADRTPNSYGVPWAPTERQSLSSGSRTRQIAAARRRGGQSRAAQVVESPSYSPADYRSIGLEGHDYATRASHMVSNQPQDVEREQATEFSTPDSQPPTSLPSHRQNRRILGVSDGAPPPEAILDGPAQRATPSEALAEPDDEGSDVSSLSARSRMIHAALGAHRDHERREDTWGFMGTFVQPVVPTRRSSDRASYMTSRDGLQPTTHVPATQDMAVAHPTVGDAEQEPTPESLDALEKASKSSKGTTDSDRESVSSTSSRDSEESLGSVEDTNSLR